MKYIIILGDGMSDYPVKRLGGKTPLMVAKTPNIDLLTSKARTGLLVTVPKDMPPGSEIANMAVLLIEAAFPIYFDDLDRPHMDIKPDVHTMRVLFRLGVSEAQSERAAIESARVLNPSYPGEIDGALWYIGRNWCFASNPNCIKCPMEKVCIKRIN